MRITSTKKTFPIYILLFALSLSIYSCSGSKSMYKKGLKLEEAGLYSEASNFYYDALKRDITNVDASIRLNNLAQVILSDKLDDFGNSVESGHNKNAVYQFFGARNFVNKLKKVNVNISIPEEQVFKFRRVKSEYIDEELNRINELLEDGKFVEARKAIKEVLKVDPDNQEIRDLDGYSTAEPIYRRAMTYFENGSFKKAFYEFDKVLNYKDAREIKALAKEKATLVIVVKPIDNESEYYDIDERLTLKIEELFSENTNPFMEIIGNEAYSRLLSERKYSKNKEWQNHTSKIFEADVFLDVTINDVVVHKGRLEEVRKKGWEIYRRKVINKETDNVTYVNDFRKVYYYEYARSKMVEVKINYQLKSFNSSEVIFNKFDEGKKYDKVIFIDFDGENNNLRSGFWVSRSEKNSRDFVDNSEPMVNSLRGMLYARRTMRTTKSMEDEIIEKLASSIVYQVDKYTNSLK
jgi:tetratricopeptide (TPR) repeat protein